MKFKVIESYPEEFKKIKVDEDILNIIHEAIHRSLQKSQNPKFLTRVESEICKEMIDKFNERISFLTKEIENLLRNKIKER